MFNPPNYSALKNFLNPKLGPWTFVLYLHRKKILESLLKARQFLTGNLLDVGCGIKPYKSILNTVTYTGIDISLSPHNQGNFDCLFDGLNIPFDDNSFDSILCTEVLEHASDPVKLFNEIYRVLKKGGFAFISVPMFIEHHESPYDFRRFTYFGIQKLALESKFTIVSIEDRGNFLCVLISNIYLAISQLISLRPISDLVYWITFPFTLLIYKFDYIKKKDPVIVSLGWQILIKK
jgi:SAM-dependent methyltransferase